MKKIFIQTRETNIAEALTGLGYDVESCCENLTYRELEKRLSDGDIVFWSQIPPQGFFGSVANVIVVASSDNQADEFLAARAGARGYISARLPDSVLSNVIDCIIKGEIWMTRETIAKVFEEYAELMDYEIFRHK